MTDCIDPRLTRIRLCGTTIVAVSIVASTMMAASGLAQGTAAMAPDELVGALREGGHVIFMRHATTERDYADQTDAVMGDCSTQRTLSEAGWQEAVMIGEAMRSLEIPVGEVISSQYCRAWQTADLAFGAYVQNPDLNFEPAEDYSAAQIETMRANVTPHLAAVPAEGVNTVLVGHDDPFEAATGIYPEPMGVVFVIRPGGDGTFEVLGNITPDQWDQIKG